jgi:hypothetical protein
MNPDPLYASSKRELWIILGTWSVFAVWVVGYCGLYGFDVPADGDSLDLVFGFPAWVFWGVGLPWSAASLFTVWFAIAVMKDHPLEQVGKETPGDEG